MLRINKSQPLITYEIGEKTIYNLELTILAYKNFELRTINKSILIDILNTAVIEGLPKGITIEHRSEEQENIIKGNRYALVICEDCLEEEINYYIRHMQRLEESPLC